MGTSMVEIHSMGIAYMKQTLCVYILQILREAIKLLLLKASDMTTIQHFKEQHYFSNKMETYLRNCETMFFQKMILAGS